MPPPWLSPAVADFVASRPDQRAVIESSSHPAVGDSKVLRPPAPVVSAAKPSGVAALPADAPKSMISSQWRGAFAALQPLFGVPTPNAWSAPAVIEPQVPAPPVKAAGKLPSGSLQANEVAASGASRLSAGRHVFSFLPPAPALFAEWADLAPVSPTATIPLPNSGLGFLSTDDQHIATLGGGDVATVGVGTTRQGVKSIKPSAGLSHPQGGSKHGRIDPEAAAIRKPRWSVLLQALNVDRKAQENAALRLSTLAVAARLASCVVRASLQQHTSAGCAAASPQDVIEWLLDALWISRLSRGCVDACSASCALGRSAPAGELASAGGMSHKASPRLSPRQPFAHDHSLGTTMGSCDCCELIVHVSVVLSISVTHSQRAAEHVGSFGPLLVDSLLAAAVPSAVLLRCNPALAAFATAELTQRPKCLLGLPKWWRAEAPALRVDLWCCEALRCMALCDCLFRSFDFPTPLPVFVEGGGDKAKTKPSLPSASVTKDASKKGGRPGGKQDSAIDAASTLAAVSAALRPISSAAGHLIAGLDSDVKVSCGHGVMSSGRVPPIYQYHALIISRPHLLEKDCRASS
jgi:hypothetical protein